MALQCRLLCHIGSQESRVHHLLVLTIICLTIVNDVDRVSSLQHDDTIAWEFE